MTALPKAGLAPVCEESFTRRPLFLFAPQQIRRCKRARQGQLGFMRGCHQCLHKRALTDQTFARFFFFFSHNLISLFVSVPLICPFFADYDNSDDRPLIPLQYQEAGVPIPTLFNGSADLTRHHRLLHHQHQRPLLRQHFPRSAPTRMGAIDFLLYNIAAMLAGVAAGYDVRLSNVSPIHPKLHPKRFAANYSCCPKNFWHLVLITLASPHFSSSSIRGSLTLTAQVIVTCLWNCACRSSKHFL